jgi:LysR family transcriptional regulator, regulator for bpeEF and oprC
VLARFQPKPYPLHVAYPPNRHVSNRLRAFIDWAVEAFARTA